MTHALGIGASSEVELGELVALVDAVLAGAGVAPEDVTAVGTVHAKEAVRALCTSRGWPLTAFPPGQLAGVDVPHPSAVAAEAVGTPSVAEAAALLLGEELVVVKTASAHATVALSRTAPRP